MSTRRPRALWMGVALLVVVVGGVVYANLPGDSGSPTDPEASPSPEEYQQFKDEDGGYQFSYPKSWVISRARAGADNARVVIAQPGTDNAFSVTITPFDEDVTITVKTSSELVAAVEDRLDRTVEEIPGMTELLSRRRLGLQDVQGWTYIYRFKDATDVEGIQVRHFFFRGNRMYQLLFQAFPLVNYGDLAETFDLVLSSFRFLEPLPVPSPSGS